MQMCSYQQILYLIKTIFIIQLRLLFLNLNNPICKLGTQYAKSINYCVIVNYGKKKESDIFSN